jgi:hypothetical protein
MEIPLRLRTVRFAALAGLCSMLVAGHADARPWVPGALKRILNMPCDPPACTLCHEVPQGGGPADKPFGNAIQGAGFFPTANENADSDAALKAALTALEGSAGAGDGGAKDGGAGPVIPPTDSDGDGVPDVTELRQCTDPNGQGGVGGPTYGCLRVAPRGPVDGVAGVASLTVLAIGAALMRRRRR